MIADGKFANIINIQPWHLEDNFNQINILVYFACVYCDVYNSGDRFEAFRS